MSKTRRAHKRYYDPEDVAWDSYFDDKKRSKNRQDDRRNQRRMKNALKTKDLDSFSRYED
jgi:hypothetical protein